MNQNQKRINISLYQNCRELPIHNFNEIIITGNLNFLVKDGSIQNDDELAVLWQSILDEFHELSDDKSYNQLLKNKAEIIYLQGKVMACEILIALFGRTLTEEQEAKVKELRSKYKIKNAKTALAHTRNRLNIKVDQFNRMTSNSESKHNLGRMISNVSRIVGYKIDRFNTTVEEWIESVKLADEIVKENQKNRDKRK